MANYSKRLEARNLRKQGISVKTIALKLGIARSTASVWVRDIILTVEQLEILRKSSIQGAELGRLRSALLQKERRRKIVEDAKVNGIRQLSSVGDSEYFVAGLALYWGEGGKKNRRVEFCNSDPKMVKFLLNWLFKYFNVQKQDVVCTVGINELHIDREKLVKDYWSKVTGIPLTQFYKTSFKHSAISKVYDNFNVHYGTLSIVVRKSTLLFYRILGLVEGLSVNGERLGSSAVVAIVS